MIKMAVMHIYGKNLKKSSSPIPVDRCKIGSTVYASTTKNDQTIPILRQGQRSRRLLHGQK